MNILYDSLPDTVRVNGVPLAIQTGHKHCMHAIDALLDGDGDPDAFLFTMYPNLPEGIDYVEAFYAALNFLHGAPIPPLPGQSSSKGDPARAYSFLYDQDAIYAAFVQQYRIDLIDKELHWWKFLALMNNLRGNNMADRIYKRTAQAESNTPKEVRERMNKERALWKLPELAAETQQQDAIVDAILGGDVERLEAALGR